MTPEGLEYIFLKEVTDSSTGIRLRLMNPIVIRLLQTQVVLAYPFKYLSAVNGKAEEIVVNYENKKNYTGCDDTSLINPTCGIKHERGVAVPYSEGFCCFCPVGTVKNTQVRGGQDCSIAVDPARSDEEKYKASAHCLRFSNIWYSVSALNDPLILHDVFLQVYNQRFLSNGSAVWVSLTHHENFELGNKNPSQFDQNKTIVATFQTHTPKNGTLTISSEENRLLIPQPMPGLKPEKIPPSVKNGATDYLLLSKSVIAARGTECDAAGISYEGFAKQEDRCNVARATCLKNQPLDFWNTDDKQRKSSSKGKYLLENFGTPYKDPIIVDKETKEHWLALEYYERQETILTIEFNADSIAFLLPGKHIQISKVVTVSFEKKITFFVSVANKDLTPVTLYVQSAMCEYEVPDSSNQSKVVPPQRDEEFVLSTQPGGIELDDTYSCTVVVRSAAYGLVASREVLVKPFRKCICNMHCQCACVGESLSCEPMSEEDFHTAGFRGSLPVLTAKPPYSPWIIQYASLAVCSLLFLLFLIGFAKAVIGYLGYRSVATFGLKSRIYQRKKISQYYEPELRKQDVVYDAGCPVNPFTGEQVKVLSDQIIFLLNTLFCCIWPLIKLLDYCRKNNIYDSFDEQEEPDGEYPDEEMELDDYYTSEHESAGQVSSDKDMHESPSVERVRKSLIPRLKSSTSTTKKTTHQTKQESLESNVNQRPNAVKPKHNQSLSNHNRVSNTGRKSSSRHRLPQARHSVSDSVLDRIASYHRRPETEPVAAGLERWKRAVGKISAMNAFRLK